MRIDHEGNQVRDAVLKQYLEHEKRTGRKLPELERGVVSASIEAAILVYQEFQRRQKTDDPE